MKKRLIPFFTLLLLLSACSAGTGEPEPDSVPPEGGIRYAVTAFPDTLGDGGADAAGNPDKHSHQPPEKDNIVEHEAAGYCGNTVTTVSQTGGEPVSFWGSDSVALTDLLYLDYSGDVCRCLPEYQVDTEFGTGYGVNLTEAYVRHDGGQVSLTEEQTELIRDILDRQSGQPE